MDMEGRNNELHRTIAGFDNYSRDVLASMHIASATPLDLTSDEIISFSYTSDVFASGEGPIGTVSTNELSVELLGKYDIAMQDELTLTLTEDISGVSSLLCTLKVYDSIYDVSTDITTITAYDRLYDILSDEPNYGLALVDTSLHTILQIIFKNQGIAADQLELDVALRGYILPYFFMQKGALGDTLNYLCEAYAIGIFVTPSGKIKATSFKSKTPTTTLTEDVHLISTKASPISIRPTTLYDVSYTTYCIKSNATVVDTTVTGLKGVISIENISLDKPLYKLACIHVISDTNVTLRDFRYDQYTVSLDLELSSDSELRVVVIGDVISSSVVQKLHSATKATMVENPYVFNKAQADELLNMYNIYSNQGAVLECEARMNPEVQNNEVASVVDHSITGNYLIVGSTFNYDGSLDGTYTLYSQEVYDGI